MSELDNATETVAPSPTVAPVDAPHLTGESSASTTDPVDTTAGAPETEPPEGQDPPKTRDRAAERRISKLTKDREEALRENGRLQGLLEARSAPVAPAPGSSEGKPQQSQFGTFEEYSEALTDWKVDQKLAARDKTSSAQTAHARSIQAHEERITAVIGKLNEAGKDIEGFGDAMETIVAPDFPLTVTMRDYLSDGSDAPALMVQWLADNPDDALRIARLDPAVAVKALEREEKRLAAKPPVRTTRTPPPPPTVSGRSSPAEPDLTKVTDMSVYAKARGYT